MKICYLKDNIKYIEEFVLICHEEWGTPWEKGEEKDKLNKKVEKEKLRLEKFPTLILLDDDNLVGFVSLFENDLDEKNYLTPWYATLYIKEEYRDMLPVLGRCVAIDFVFIFISFFAYLWVDDIEAKKMEKKSIDNSLDWLWKNV